MSRPRFPFYLSTPATLLFSIRELGTIPLFVINCSVGGGDQSESSIAILSVVTSSGSSMSTNSGISLFSSVVVGKGDSDG